ncbi:ribosomal RNA-processing protein 7-domain-containing protein [Diplogelasinospora grovesii]|uniref:Ribosomal RNA-processing protein 7-domain-containing protein n=1 Tax=Diplogelasinospora grovesii TaxID=303347 RepID=A0AAN6S9V5_9PEZI|nr:ribosomal RNA-processing protein 7-domain-containing protein [Diplogelasinospora grovesii]
MTTTLGEFSVLPVSIPPLPSFKHAAVHYLYVRRNAPKVPTALDSRSLFLTNVPVDSTDLHLRGLFASLVGAGRFESVSFADERAAAAAAAAREPSADSLLPASAARLLRMSRKRKHTADEEERIEEELRSRLPDTWTRRVRKSGGTAVVVLADEKSVEQVLKAIAKTHKSKKYPTWGEGVEKKVPGLGSAWIKAHNRMCYPDKDMLQASVDAFSAVFARREAEAQELAKRLRNEPDEDGFVTVTRGGGRTAPASRNEAEEARKKMIQKAEKKKEELQNFYRFQLRERKKEQQQELVKQFEEDRRKIQELKERRGRFRPEA